MNTATISTQTVRDYLNEMQWYANTMANDKGIKISLLRPASINGLTSWEAAFWVLKDIENFISEEENGSNKKNGQACESCPKSSL